MGETSKIDWLTRGTVTGGTWNPWLSCSHAQYQNEAGQWVDHPGCLNCYAEALMDARYSRCEWGPDGNRVMTAPSNWKKLDRYDAAARAAGVLTPFFPSLCDPFDDWHGLIHNAKRQVVWRCQNCGDFVPDTGPQPVGDMVRRREGARCHHELHPATLDDLRAAMFARFYRSQLELIVFTKRPHLIGDLWPRGQQGLSNLTLCYSASDQPSFDWGSLWLYRYAPKIAGAVGFSLEPLLAPIDLAFAGTLPASVSPAYRNAALLTDWVVIGVESNGPKVGRLGEFATEADWWAGCADIVRQCKAWRVPVYVKQGPVDGRVSHDPAEWPEQCRVREFPVVRTHFVAMQQKI